LQHYIGVQGRDRSHENDALPQPTPDDIAALPPSKRLTAREGRLALGRGPIRWSGATLSVEGKTSGDRSDRRHCYRETNQLINNRQGGRRRGRGGQRPQGMPGNAGNRPDNRQRGNAAQLLEKYKTLARDAQLAGDRVQTEYYLQYADHYFRVLEESRSRFEEQQAQRRPRRDEEEFESDGDEEQSADAESSEDAENSSSPNELGFPHGEIEARQRPSRDRGRERGRDRFERRERHDYQADGPSRDQAVEADEEEGDERISLGVLPPPIGAAEDAAEEEEAPKLRRRTRKPRAEEGDEEIAPAA
jgi:hypothetical protein